MATFDLPELPETRVSPQLMLGAASPLWVYFGAAAAGGVAYWWMTRWTQPMNLEALFGARPAVTLQPAIEAAAAPIVEAAETVAETTDAAVEATAEAVAETLPEAPVGGEAAPISPLVEVLAPPEPEPAAEPTIEAAPEPIVDAAPEPAIETPPEPMVEATADPLPAPVGKPRVRKPANGLEA